MCSLFEWGDFQVPLNVLGYPTPDGPLQGEDAQCGEGRENIPWQRRRFVEGRDCSTWMFQEVSLKG